MLNVYCEMCTHVAKDDQAHVEHISKDHNLGLYLIALQKKITKLANRTDFQ
jgi:hypothetical protein